MATTRPKRMSGPAGDAPLVTIGDLRRRLKQTGAAWEPDPTLSDDEPIPRPPTGGLATAEPLGLLAPDERLDDRLKNQGAPEAPAELVELWKSEGLLDRR